MCGSILFYTLAFQGFTIHQYGQSFRILIVLYNEYAFEYYSKNKTMHVYVDTKYINIY